MNDDVRLEPLAQSPLLQRIGVIDAAQGTKAPTPLSVEWRKARTAAYGTSELKESEEKGVEEEVINGIRVKHYV